MISVTHSGSFRKMESFLYYMKKLDIMRILSKFGDEGVRALSSATPMDTGRASISWRFDVVREGSLYSIIWSNSDVENGFPVAIMLQYGYGTGTGGYVQGRDYINPAIKPIFDKIANEVWKVVIAA